MPIISTFFGIVVRMFYQEHEPPHFHVEHQGQHAKCNYDGDIIAGQIRSATARDLTRRWAASHRRELEANWEKMKAGRALDRIEPLE
jgi:mRNA-degrading endonuclease toxin of MazEF toxin-antitoxin module